MLEIIILKKEKTLHVRASPSTKREKIRSFTQCDIFH